MNIFFRITKIVIFVKNDIYLSIFFIQKEHEKVIFYHQKFEVKTRIN